jgi:hypothetical protein
MSNRKVAVSISQREDSTGDSLSYLKHVRESSMRFSAVISAVGLAYSADGSRT